MAVERRVLATRLSKDEAYDRCFKRAAKLGLHIQANIRGQRLEVANPKGAWVRSLFGRMGSELAADHCHLIFDDDGPGATVTAWVAGDAGHQFFNEVAAILAQPA